MPSWRMSDSGSRWRRLYWYCSAATGPTSRARATSAAGGVGDPAVADLALPDQALDFSPRFLDRRVAVDVVELEQVDALALQPAQARLDIGANGARAQIHPVAPLRVGQRAALREHEDLVAPTEGAAHDPLRASPAVERRRVDPVHAGVERRVDRADRLGLVLRPPPNGPVAPGADRRRADADWRDLYVGERSRLHAADATCPRYCNVDKYAWRIASPQKSATTEPIARNGPKGLPILRAFEPWRADRTEGGARAPTMPAISATETVE